RRSLNSKQQSQAAENLLARILVEDIFNSALNITFYQAFDGEINPSLAMQAAFKQAKRCFLPVISQTKETLTFVEYKSGASLSKNSFGILEPKLYPNDGFAEEHMDLIFIPLVAFDQNGTRLGIGKGYYDKKLAFKLENSDEKSLTSREKPKLIGLAHECQRVEELERAEWDVPMDKIITDQATYTINA
ncbi:MAG: 5-formyltetrahydrofolate cyclo-ligase, partial [Pseudohongiellaceae bacterium]